jgi:hypothetical protein
MTSYRGHASPAPVGPARYLGHLHQDLTDLGRRLREAIAQAVGRTAADIVTESVRRALAGALTLAPPHGPAIVAGLSRDPRYGPGEPAWPPEDDPLDEGGQYRRDAYRGGEAFDGDPARTPGQDEGPREEAWILRLAAGLEVASWWLRNSPGLTPGQAALAAALVAAVVALLGGGSVLAAVGLAAAALRLLAVADAARSGAAALGRAADECDEPGQL